MKKEGTAVLLSEACDEGEHRIDDFEAKDDDILIGH